MSPHDPLRAERNAGLLLVAATLVALVVANSPLAHGWHDLLERPLGVALPTVGALTPHLLVADGLMALFFLLIGLEVKREWFEGRLARPSDRLLPIVAAVAGMAVPALAYLVIIRGDPALVRGWAIPAATDIAFVIGVIALLGKRVPPSIRLLLVTLAIVDDIGAVIIIALFYSAPLDLVALAGAAVVAGSLWMLGRRGVRSLTPFVAGFVLLWFLVLASGIHPTIAGVVAALTIPLGSGESHSPLKHLEHALHPWVMFGVVPLFALVASGVAMDGAGGLFSPLPLGIAAGLFLGKQLGIFAAIRAAVAFGAAPRPAGASWTQLYGASILCGIGFTMSLFIGGLAFPGEVARIEEAKLGTLAGSLLSALIGFALLRRASPGTGSAEDEAAADELFAAEHRD